MGARGVPSPGSRMLGGGCRPKPASGSQGCRRRAGKPREGGGARGAQRGSDLTLAPTNAFPAGKLLMGT